MNAKAESKINNRVDFIWLNLYKDAKRSSKSVVPNQQSKGNWQ